VVSLSVLHVLVTEGNGIENLMWRSDTVSTTHV
jgi:hypothetical protein